MPFAVMPPYYSVWQNMLNRCRNPNFKQWADYGGRGITVCERWLTYANFAADMGPRPDGYTLERKDTNGNDEPGNVEWASRTTQQRNQRRTVFLTIEGVRHKLSDLADRTTLKSDTIAARAKRGLSLADCLDASKRFPKEGQWIKAVQTRKAKAASKTHCRQGHELTPENTYVTKEGWRQCRVCHNAKMRRMNERRRHL